MMTTIKLLVYCTLLLILNNAYAQDNTIKMTTEQVYANEELFDLMRFEGVDYYKTKFEGTSLKEKFYSITVKEIWKGKIKNIDTLINSAEGFPGRLTGDILTFRVAAKKSGARKLKVNFFFDRFSLQREYKCVNSDDYSLRDIGARLPVEAEKPFYAFAYILPSKHKDGSSSWCEVDSSGKDIENWGKEFGIEHYLLIEMNFTAGHIPAARASGN
jgi:hypothetical protein